MERREVFICMTNLYLLTKSWKGNDLIHCLCFWSMLPSAADGAALGVKDARTALKIAPSLEDESLIYYKSKWLRGSKTTDLNSLAHRCWGSANVLLVKGCNRLQSVSLLAPMALPLSCSEAPMAPVIWAEFAVIYPLQIEVIFRHAPWCPSHLEDSLPFF